MKLTAALAFEDAPNLIKFFLLSSLFFLSSVNLIWVFLFFLGEKPLSCELPLCSLCLPFCRRSQGTSGMIDALTLFYSFGLNSSHPLPVSPLLSFLSSPPLSISIPYAPSVLPLFIVHITGTTRGYFCCLSYFLLPPSLVTFQFRWINPRSSRPSMPFFRPLLRHPALPI